MLALIPLFPLLGFLANGTWYAAGQAPAGRRKAHATIPGVIATLAIFASFIVCCLAFFRLHAMPAQDRVLEQLVYHWITISGFNIDAALRMDALSVLFTLVITGVGTLIHLYSIGYMAHDNTPGKFFAYLNLFCFAMLVLVLGSSLPVMFLGWEGVGLCSYLLIGYWYEDEEKAKAGKKAFIVNRVGDFGFLLGMFLIFWTFGTLDFAQLAHVVGQHGLPAGVGQGVITAICLLLFVGCCGKSAQIPLYVWLPDAMAGPTPVSALIHAATMVTSGIYLVSRLNFLYNLSPEALSVVAAIGAFTAFFAATIAIVQTDIKKILAYSTVSQLGYMFLGCGVGAYAAGVFHVITHAFFKGLLFLGAGSVIHGMHEQQNIFKMGGLKKYMPVTCLTFMAAWLAISGIPPFAGFFSKDEILWQAFSSPRGSTLLWAIGWVTAILTAFYMTRLVYLTFLGEPRFEQEHHGHGGVHESPLVMLIPLVILAALSIFGGLIGIPHLSWIEHWLEPVIAPQEALKAASMTGAMEALLSVVSVLGAAAGLGIAWVMYKDVKVADELRKRFPVLHQVVENKWYIDEIYDVLFVKPIHFLAETLWKGFDVAVIDRVVVGVGRVSEWTGQTVRVVQTGSIQIYAFALLLGVVATVGYLIYGLV